MWKSNAKGEGGVWFFFCITSTSPASNQFFGIKTQIGPRCNLTAGAFVNLDCCAFVFENVKVGVGGITSKKTLTVKYAEILIGTLFIPEQNGLEFSRHTEVINTDVAAKAERNHEELL